MRLRSFAAGDGELLAVETADGLVAASDLVPGGPRSLGELIRRGPSGHAALREADHAAAPALHTDDLVELPSVPAPPNIIAIGRNYAEHAAEEDAGKPPAPEIFLKHTSTLAANQQEIVWDPGYTTSVDWEAELGVVIGRLARNVAVEDALDFVFGYTAFNDVSARDLQFEDLQWARGKSLETFGPCGPALVTADEIPDPQSLAIRLLLNDTIMQESSTSRMYFSVAEIISWCSRAFTLKPGDLIVTGTPGGVGAFREPPVWMADGDTVAVEIDVIGRLENTCRTRENLLAGSTM
jgi:2-keto-4-pentenoate hydratase/2-oxohepta-3-ene-1,7-dioic acid hydratase in catechol pathway